MKGNQRNDSVFSKKIRAGKRRTYFIDVRQTRGNDYYITLTESTRKFQDDRVERHKIFLYREDFNRFLESLEECINYVKNELMPNFDYEEFDRRQEEWEANQEQGVNDYKQHSQNDAENSNNIGSETSSKETSAPDEDDLSW